MPLVADAVAYLVPFLARRNFNPGEFADRVGGVQAVQKVYVNNPELDKGARKLSGPVQDRINPKSWEGDVDPTGVNVHEAWVIGGALAAKILQADGVYTAEETNYATIATKEKATMLKPLGPKYIDAGGVVSGPGYGDNGRPGVSARIVPPEPLPAANAAAHAANANTANANAAAANAAAPAQ